jgi:LacI family transcriptional regulator
MKTVSRVLNDEAHVRPALKERVLAAVEALSYKPHFAARQLAGTRSFVIAQLTLEFNASYYAHIALAAASECRKLGYHLVSETVPIGEALPDAVARVTARLRPDGIILPPPLCDDPKLISLIRTENIPLVRFASSSEGYGTAICAPETEAAKALVRHLLDLGHRRIGFIAPPSGHSSAGGRRAGYEAALREAGLPLDPALIDSGNFAFASGALAARRLLAQSQRPTAIFAANDAMALGTLAIAGELGLRVPEDLAIAGFDDSPGSRMCYPALTTVRQPLEAMARAAVLTLLGRNEPVVPLTHHLLIRGSTNGIDRLVLDTLDG